MSQVPFTTVDRPSHRPRGGTSKNAELRRAVKETKDTGKAIKVYCNGIAPMVVRNRLCSTLYRDAALAHCKLRSAMRGSELWLWFEPVKEGAE